MVAPVLGNASTELALVFLGELERAVRPSFALRTAQEMAIVPTPLALASQDLPGWIVQPSSAHNIALKRATA